MPGSGKIRQLRFLTRSTIASCIATSSEFALLPLLVHVAKLPHWVCYALVQFVANAITFLLYKYWAFEAGHVGSWRGQYAKQLLVFAVSLVSNTAIPSLFSYHFHLQPVLAFAISQVIVYLGWNYPMNRYWVFRAAIPQQPTPTHPGPPAAPR